MLDLKKVQKRSKPQWGRKIRNVLVREKSKMNRLGSLKNLAKKLLPRRRFQPRWKQRIYRPTGFYRPPHPMNIFVWNVRDLGSSREFNILQSYKQEIKPELMFLIETKSCQTSTQSECG